MTLDRMQIPVPDDFRSDWFTRYFSFDLACTSAARRGRKMWEDAVICDTLERAGCLKPGRRGIGFGVGNEPLPAYFASRGVDILATDAPLDDRIDRNWRSHGWHAATLDDLRYPAICDDRTLESRVTVVPVDMRDVARGDLSSLPGDWLEVDFVWSGNALDHLGSIDAGIHFVEQSSRLVRKGGWVVHTTEFNTEIIDAHVDNDETVFFRARDLFRMATCMRQCGVDVRWANLHYLSAWPPFPNDVIIESTQGAIVTSVLIAGHKA